jgi:indolepyruvate ferredoxin oxidoreductase
VNPDDFSVRMPGIGGTGVITVAQIVGTAALLDGKYVTGLDQTGLAQKGGAVVSDLHVTAGPAPGSAKVPAGGVDLLLAFDLVVALNPANLSGASPDRTVVVATSTQTPTGQMIGTGARQPEVAAMTDVINARTRADVNIYVDMAAVAHDLFGSTTTANIFGLGIAYQLGALPVSAASLERAITLNGVAVQSNLRAFRWGRLRVANPAELDTARAAAASTRVDKEPAAPVVEAAGNLDVIASAGGVRFGGELGRLAASRAVDLAGYQDQGYARQYLADVARVADAEQAVLPGSTALAEAVARYLYKLMAYKDEYEVARLHLADEAQARVQAVTRGEPATVHWVLHPPALRAIGMKDKISLGPWFRPAFTALHAMRRVRGTRLDPFGYAHVRRVERQLIDQYRSWLRALPGTLTAASHPVAVEIAAAPDMVRGYENIKLGNVQRYQATRGALLKRYAADAVPGGPPGS